ncbi:hypothetical protein F0562_000473 [Nyssa sinensis]|uniref:Fe2OG dioxygenase domain-containing protein n=1 Tax=Nyssa sinensis TaxID=561372 RepID=A0A5J5C0P4_9ASTE|nr:hypothetical protein F0562_000473 [Nyssa sinensis]
MDVSVDQENLVHSVLNHDRMKELKAFDDMKVGVKGLADAGMLKIPKIFVRPPVELAEELNCRHTHIQVPVIDFTGIQRVDRRKEIVGEVRIASEKWGFFQVVNHGIPLSVLEKMIDGIRLFHEQDVEVKKQFYTRDRTRKAIFNSNFDLYQSRTANWRDTLGMILQASDHLDPNELPATCREAVMDYARDVKKLGDTLFELLSEGLGLKPDHLRTMECVNGCNIYGHYYPACPEPKLTLGLTEHSDPGFLTILLQNQINGLQVLYENQWVDVLPIPGGLVVNIGDLLQMISNSKYTSNVHRVIANSVGPRISVASFFGGPVAAPKLYGPIKELISEENPPLYRDVLYNEYAARLYSRGLDEKPVLEYYKL